MSVNLMVSFILGQVTRRSSPITSPKSLNSPPRRSLFEPNLCCKDLSHFPVEGVEPTPWTIFLKLKPLRVVSSTLV
jgi:hypothetical protein